MIPRDHGIVLCFPFELLKKIKRNYPHSGAVAEVTAVPLPSSSMEISSLSELTLHQN